MIKTLSISMAVVLFLATPANAHAIVAAAAALWTGATALASTVVGGFLLRMAIGAGLTALQRARQKKKQSRGAGLTREATTTGEATPQSFIIGRYATGGNAVCPAMSHGSWKGAPNGILTYVIDLGDVPVTGLDEIYLSGELIEFGGIQHPDGLGETATGHFEGNVFYRFHDGTQTEADAFLMDKYGDYPERPWSSEMVGSGVPYAVVNIGYDRALYSGWPALRFVVRGIPLYDPRKDSSVGGSGPQRWDDPATWEFSENAIVAGYNVLRGIRLGGDYVWGGGAGFEDLPLSVWAAAMTAADPVSEGGTAPIPKGFRVGFEVTTDEEPFDVFDRFMQAAGAEYVEVGGVWLVRVGPPSLPVYFFTDDDVIRTQERDLDPFPDIKSTVNAVHGSYPSPADGWEVKDAPGVYDPEFEAADAGQRLVTDLEFEAVPFLRQVKYLMRAWQKDARRFLQHTLTLPPDALRVNPLDSVSWTSARHGYAAKVFEVDKAVVNGANLTTSLALRERDAADYVPDPADDPEEQAPSSGVVSPPVVQVPGFSAEPVTVRNEDGSRKRSGIRIIWSQTATAFRGLKWKIRRAGQGGEILHGSTLNLTDGYEDVFAGIIPGQMYYVSARIMTDLAADWTTEVEVQVAESGVSPGELTQEAWQAISDDAAEVAGGLITVLDETRLAPMEAEITRVDRRINAQQVEQRSVATVLGVINGQVLWMLERLSTVQGHMADAGIEVDPATGQARIYGIDATAERVSEVEIRLNAAEGSLALSATQAWVNQEISQQISYALTDPSQIPLLDDLQIQVNQVQINLDAANAAIAIKADQLVVDGVSASLNSAWVQIGEHAASLALTVQRDEFDALEARQSTAEITLNNLDGPRISQTVADTRALLGANAAVNAATLADLLQQYDQAEALRRDLAYAQQDMHARVTDEGKAMAEITASLGAQIGTATALIEAESRVRATENSARAAEIKTLQADVGAASGAITELNRVAADSASGTARAVHQLQLDVTVVEGSISATADALQGVTTRVTNAEEAVDAVSQYALDLNARLANAESDLTAQGTAQQQVTTRVTQAENTLTVHSQALTELAAEIDDPATGLTALSQATTQLDTQVSDHKGQLASQASSITNLSTTLNSHTASISQVMSAVDGINAEYALRINNNGVVSGMIVRSDLDDQGKPTTAVAFTADKFAIAAPDGASQSVPFVHYATEQTINGKVYPAGTYLQNVFIDYGSIGRLQMQDVIQSDNYAQDASGEPTQGIKINFRTGAMKVAGPVLSRNIVAAEGSFWTGGPIAVNSGAGMYEVTQWDLVETGLQVPVDQVWMASNATYIAYAAFEGGATAPGGISGNSEYWGCTAEVLPFARWSGPQQLYLRISLWAKGISALHRAGNTALGGKIHWKLYRVT